MASTAGWRKGDGSRDKGLRLECGDGLREERVLELAVVPESDLEVEDRLSIGLCVRLRMILLLFLLVS